MNKLTVFPDKSNSLVNDVVSNPFHINAVWSLDGQTEGSGPDTVSQTTNGS